MVKIINIERKKVKCNKKAMYLLASYIAFAIAFTYVHLLELLSNPSQSTMIGTMYFTFF